MPDLLGSFMETALTPISHSYSGNVSYLQDMSSFNSYTDDQVGEKIQDNYVAKASK